MEQEILKWSGPYKFCRESYIDTMEKDSIFNKPGVYLWSYQIKDIQYIHYIGQTDINFKQRFGEHFKPILNGNGWIYDFGFIQRLICEGDFFRTEDFLQYKNNTPAELGAKYLEKMNFFICPVENSKRTTKEIEKYLICKVVLNEGLSAKLFLLNTDNNNLASAKNYIKTIDFEFLNEFPSGIKIDSL